MIEIQHITKTFILPHERKHTIFEYILAFLKMKIEHDRYYALKDITIDIQKGTVLGIIGDNGSGKSTLLRLIAKILVPDSGEIISQGTIVSFIELGVGFQDELTGKENVYLYGILNGMSRKEISNKYKKIVNYSGVKKFMNAKLKTFSSGMKLRLAFATAIQTNPDILILDDILSVGDSNFQKKCYSTFDKFKKEGKTIILAYHNIKTINKFCDKVLYLQNGKQIAYGPTRTITEIYIKQNRITGSQKKIK